MIEVTTELSLRPQKEKNKEKIFENTFEPEREIFRLHQDTMINLHKLEDKDFRLIDKFGIYPRIIFLKGANPNEVRDWYDFGSISTIYLSTPKFPEIKRLPKWVIEGVINTYTNNPTIKYDDSLALDLFSNHK